MRQLCLVVRCLRVGALALPRAAATRCAGALESLALACALLARLKVLTCSLCVGVAGTQASMAAPDAPASLVLFEAAQILRSKGRFARAAEKFGDAVAAAAQEQAEDSVVVAVLRALQAGALMFHSFTPTVPVAEADEARQTALTVLLPQCMSTLTRRKAARTVLPGRCRAAEVAWSRTSLERCLDTTVERARAIALASAPETGLDAFWISARICLESLNHQTRYSMPRDMQLSLAAFVALALELMARPHKLPTVVLDGEERAFPSPTEQYLAHKSSGLLQDERFCSGLDSEAVSLMAAAWRRVERSGMIAMRALGEDPDGIRTLDSSLATAAAEAAVRGLRECALAGCTSKEVHVSQFKHCGACQQAFFCCREHQLSDWPSHKAACKAARKAAAPSK